MNRTGETSISPVSLSWYPTTCHDADVNRSRIAHSYHLTISGLIFRMWVTCDFCLPITDLLLRLFLRRRYQRDVGWRGYGTQRRRRRYIQRSGSSSSATRDPSEEHYQSLTLDCISNPDSTAWIWMTTRYTLAPAVPHNATCTRRQDNSVNPKNHVGHYTNTPLSKIFTI